MSREMKLNVMLIAALLVFAALWTWVLLVPLNGRHNAIVSNHKEAHCHSLGAGYHWWDDRSQCVRYVPLGTP